MKVSQWAEIRRLAEVEKLSQRAIARRLRCCQRTVKKALDMEQPPDETRRPERGSILDPYKPKIQALIEKCPELSAMRVLEELRKGVRTLRRKNHRAAGLPAADPSPGGGGFIRRCAMNRGRRCRWIGAIVERSAWATPPAVVGLRGRALLQPSVLPGILPLPTQGGILPVARSMPWSSSAAAR